MAEKRKTGNIFFKVPKVLFTDVVYCSISTDAKMLYALLLDRQQLSKKNGLITRFGDPFVYMTIAETCVKLQRAGVLRIDYPAKSGIRKGGEDLSG